jgi:arylsulfatase A-like enzyme
MQPHSPYFASSRNYGNLKEYEKKPFKALKEDEKEKVWGAYLDNLRYALDDIERLLQNVDGDVVISADHGELMGDHGMYYHMPGNIHPKLKKVPWVRVKGDDKQTAVPDVTLDGVENAQEVSEEQLEALGYL